MQGCNDSYIARIELVLCGPNVLANPFNPVSKLVNPGVPLFKPVTHTLNLLHVENFRLHPVDLRDPSDLINRAPKQAEGQRLHHQMLDLVRLDLGLGRNGVKSEVAVVRGSAEDHLRQC